MDHCSGCWPEAKFLRKPNTKNILEFLRNYISRHGIPQVIRTDLATFFRSKRFKEFCQKRLIQHIECPVGDHRSNGKIERLIGTIHQRMRTNKQLTVRKGNLGLSEIFFALRMYPSAKRKSALHTRNRRVRCQILSKCWQ